LSGFSVGPCNLVY